MPESLSDLLETPVGTSDAYHKGYIKMSLLHDPWGAHYHYILIPGTKDTYVLFSFGSDSQPGGEGAKLDHFSLGSSGIE